MSDEGIYDHKTTLEREQLHRDYYDNQESKEVPFRIVARLRYFDVKRLTPFDMTGSCSMCSIEIVYDRHATTDSKPKVCIPCALRLYQNGMRELTALGSYMPTDEDLDDSTMMAKLHANMIENQKYGAVDPQVVRPGDRGRPQHDLHDQSPILRPGM